jgi:AraC family transcriptional regulator
MVAGIQISGVSVEIRDNVFDPAEDLPIVNSKYVLGSSLTSIPQPSQGRYVLHRPGDFTNIGPLVFSPANVPWHIRTGGGRFRTITCEYDTEKFRAVTGHGSEWNDHELRACQDIQSARITQTLQRLGEEAVAPGFASEILVETLSVSLLIDLMRFFQGIRATEMTGRGGLEAWQLRRIEDYVRGLSGARPSLGQMAALCGMGDRTFMRRFKASTGQTVTEFVQRQLVAKARLLLAETNLPLKEISFRLGFASPSDFSFAFRRAVGQPPSQFRRQPGIARVS